MTTDAYAAERKRLRELPDDVTLWKDEDLDLVLTRNYAPTVIPPCSICGGPLSCERCGGGAPTVWACSGLDDGPAYRYKEGRAPADEHYVKSQFVDRRQGGDAAVMELLRRHAAAVAAAVPGRCRDCVDFRRQDHCNRWRQSTDEGGYCHRYVRRAR
jgi:hypothetical protein